ncbi:MAG: hypothetical protein QXM22_04500 [Candidatus Bathyarchaeia archaeon]
MSVKTNKKPSRQGSKQYASRMPNMRLTGLIDYYSIELENWVQYVIEKSEKNGDVCKRNRFVALRTELSC